jgi:hypothetical protein
MDERRERSAEVETGRAHVETAAAPAAGESHIRSAAGGRIIKRSSQRCRPDLQAPPYPRSRPSRLEIAAVSLRPIRTDTSSPLHSTASDAPMRPRAAVLSLPRLSSLTDRRVPGGDTRQRDGSTRSRRWLTANGRGGCIRRKGSLAKLNDAVETAFAGRRARSMQRLRDDSAHR